MVDDLEQVLENCLGLMDQGVSVEDCLAAHPRLAEDLEPLLRTASTVQGNLTPGMPQTAKRRARTRVMEEWDRRHQPSGQIWAFASFLPRWAAVAAALVLAIFLGGAGTVSAAGNAIPGDYLYPVKEARENTQLWLGRSPEAKVDIYSRMVKERVKELRKLAMEERIEDSSVALTRLQSHVAGVAHLAEQGIQQSGDTPRAISSKLLSQLEEAMTEQRSAESVLQETLNRSPANAGPGIKRALEAIQRGRERVRSAVAAAESAAPGAPPSKDGG